MAPAGSGRGSGIRNAAVQIALIVLGVPMLAIGLIHAHTFYADLTRPDLPWPPPGERVQFPEHHRWGQAAVSRFAALSPRRRDALLDGLAGALEPIPEWIEDLNRRPVAVLCIGENHDPYLRRFLAERLFPALRADALLIEATPREAARMRSGAEQGGDEIALLGADIAGVLRSALAANPALRIDGIEERDDQVAARKQRGVGSREDSIEANLRASYRPGRRHVVLFGAFHCSTRNAWLFQRLRRRPPMGAPNGSILSLRAAWEHLEGPFESFVYFLDEVGFPREDFVIPSTGALPAAIADWFPFLGANEIRAFDAIVVFRAGQRGAR